MKRQNYARRSEVRNWFSCVAFFLASFLASQVPCSFATPSQQSQSTPAASTGVVRQIGAIKAINAENVTLTPDSGPELNIAVQSTTRIVRVAPGEKDLKNATPIQLEDLQVGDRVLVAGKTSGDSPTMLASSVVVMKRSDLQARDQQNLQDWQKRGVDGLVKTVDPSAGTITISARGKNLIIHSSSTTVIRRYPPDSVKFEDAKTSTLPQVQSGDQVRARGEHSADGNDFTAEEIVFGTFKNFAGTVESVDASSSTLTVHDVLSKKNVTVKITPDSLLRQLPPEMAQMMAKRLKAAALSAMSGATNSGASTSDQSARPGGASGSSGGNASGQRPGGAPDLQRLISRAPAVSLADLHKGDAVVILSTEGTGSGAGTAITLVSGVEPILQAAPNAGQAMMLAPWSLGAPSGGDAGP
jgi:hypothetical protein